MNLKEFKFPSASGNFGFSTLKTDPKLLKEAKKRGFYEEKTPYNALFSELFFSGGKLNFKKDLPEDFKSSATEYLLSFMRSFEPKHEEKEAVSALILSELVDIDTGGAIEKIVNILTGK